MGMCEGGVAPNFVITGPRADNPLVHTKKDQCFSSTILRQAQDEAVIERALTIVSKHTFPHPEPDEGWPNKLLPSQNAEN